MMEILYRAKRKDNGEWIYGYPMRHPQAAQVGPYEPYWNMFVPPANPEDAGGVFDIDPDTLCQYTGLKDKNEERIWENDIVKDESVCLLGTVIWHCDDYVGWLLNDKYAECPQMMDKDMWEDCEIIGNIFDNPELLEPNTPTEN